jgi:hypothetical protein
MSTAGTVKPRGIGATYTHLASKGEIVRQDMAPGVGGHGGEKTRRPRGKRPRGSDGRCQKLLLSTVTLQPAATTPPTGRFLLCRDPHYPSREGGQRAR